MGAILVGIKTCHRLDYYIDDLTVDYVQQRGWRHPNQQERVNAQRDTWLKNLPDGFDYKFFYGSTLRTQKLNQRAPDSYTLRQPLSDELFLPCGDNYTSNPLKVRQMCAYAMANGYAFLVVVDDDTYLDAGQLIATDFPGFHYSGAPTETFHPGSCVILSRIGMQAILDSPSFGYADDQSIGYVLGKAGIKPHSIPEILHGFGDAYRVTLSQARTEKHASWHSCSPAIMRELWTLHTTSLLEQQKATAGAASKTTPSPLVSPVSVEEKSSSSVILPMQHAEHCYPLDSNLSTISRSDITPSSNDSESLETGLEKINLALDLSSTVMSETLSSSETPVPSWNPSPQSSSEPASSSSIETNSAIPSGSENSTEKTL